MANDFKCSYCGGNGTRCNCIIENGGGKTFVSDKEKIKERMSEIEADYYKLTGKRLN